MSKVAVVTGSSKGIGAATALAFANTCYDVVINYHMDELAARDVVAAVEQLGRRATTVQADVSTEHGIKKLFEHIRKDFGSIDVLVNNMRLPAEPVFGVWTEDSISSSLTNNLISAMLCTQAAVPLMGNGGSILFTSSIYGLTFGASPNLPLYSAGKAGIISFAQSMAEKLAPNIRCNVVAPGTTRTPAWNSAKPEYARKSLDMTLQKEWVEPEEIANAFVFLAETPHITSQVVVIDAGWQKKIRGA